MMRRRTGLDANEARRQFLKARQNVAAFELAAHHYIAVRIGRARPMARMCVSSFEWSAGRGFDFLGDALAAAGRRVGAAQSARNDPHVSRLRTCAAATYAGPDRTGGVVPVCRRIEPSLPRLRPQGPSTARRGLCNPASARLPIQAANQSTTLLQTVLRWRCAFAANETKPLCPLRSMANSRATVLTMA